MKCTRSVDITSKRTGLVSKNIGLALQNCRSLINPPISQQWECEQQSSCDYAYTLSSIPCRFRARNDVDLARRAVEFQLQCRRHLSSSARLRVQRSLPTLSRPPLAPPAGQLTPRSFGRPPPRPISPLLSDDTNFRETIALTSDEIVKERAKREAIRIANERKREAIRIAAERKREAIRIANHKRRLLEESRFKEFMKGCWWRIDVYKLFYIGFDIPVRIFVQQELEKARCEARAYIDQSRLLWQRRFDWLQVQTQQCADVLDAFSEECQSKLEEARKDGKLQYHQELLWETHYKTHLQPIALRIKIFIRRIQRLQHWYLDLKFSVDMRPWVTKKLLLQASAATDMDARLKDPVHGMHMMHRELLHVLDEKVMALRVRLEDYSRSLPQQFLKRHQKSLWQISTSFSHVELNTVSLIRMSHHWRSASRFRGLRIRSPVATSVNLPNMKVGLLFMRLEDSTAGVRNSIHDFVRLENWRTGRYRLTEIEDQHRLFLKTTKYWTAYKLLRDISDDTTQVKTATRIFHVHGPELLTFGVQNPMNRVLTHAIRPFTHYVDEMHLIAQAARDPDTYKHLPASVRDSSSYAMIQSIAGDWLFDQRRTTLRLINALQLYMAASLQMNPALLRRLDLSYAKLRANWRHGAALSTRKPQAQAIHPPSIDSADHKAFSGSQSVSFAYDLPKGTDHEDDEDTLGRTSSSVVFEGSSDDVDGDRFISPRRHSIFTLGQRGSRTSKARKRTSKHSKLVFHSSKKISQHSRIDTKLSRARSKASNSGRGTSSDQRTEKRILPVRQLISSELKRGKSSKSTNEQDEEQHSQQDGKDNQSGTEVDKVVEPVKMSRGAFTRIRQLFGGN